MRKNKRISNSQIACITLLWAILVYFVIKNAVHIDGMVIFSIIASAIIVFVPIYKNRKRFRDNG